MNITYLIGNGFDLNLGLKTKYTDFYPYFLANSSANNIIKNWLEEDMGDDSRIELWADLELVLGECTERLKEDDLDQFYSDYDEMIDLLVKYLKQQQEKIFVKDEDLNDIVKELQRSFNAIMEQAPKKQKLELDKIFKKYLLQNRNYNFFSYNYTDTLNRILKIIPSDFRLVSHYPNYYSMISNKIQVHGSLDHGVILGVNDESQIKGDLIKNNPNITLIKKEANEIMERFKY